MKSTCAYVPGWILVAVLFFALALSSPGQQDRPDPRSYRVRALPMATGAVSPCGSGAAMTYDVSTAKVSSLQIRLEPFPSSLRVRGSGGVLTGPGEVELGRVDNFGPLAIQGGYTGFPWRMNVKLIMTFPNNSTYVGSGVLIDPEHVLTAGHCVHDAQLGGWATRIKVIPAYNGHLTPVAAREPYGHSLAVQLHSWSGWTTYQDSSHDVGVIDLDRPVGALTGWFGFGYDTACSFFTTPLWEHVSYPAESPYDGELMYYQNGDFDHCPSVWEARYSRRGYGGESGSGFYKILNGSRYIYAVLSHRHTNNDADAVRLDPVKFNHIIGFMNADTPATFDLTPLEVRGPTTITAGGTLSSLNFLAHNYSKSSFSGNLLFTVHLSTDNKIDTTDPAIGTYSVPAAVSSLGNARLSTGVNGPRVPVGTAPGEYYIGIILTTPDADPFNQHTRTPDVLKIQVDSQIQVTGRVLVRASPAVPIRSALVEVLQNGKSLADPVATAPDGTYSIALPASAAPGSYTVRATLPAAYHHPPVVNFRYPGAAQTPILNPDHDPVPLVSGNNRDMDIYFPKPVILVHGLNGSADSWRVAETLLRKDPARKSRENTLAHRGYLAWSVTYGPLTQHLWKSHQANADALNVEITNLRNSLSGYGLSGAPVDLVCHSMGGIVARAYLHYHARYGDVDRVFTFGTPHAGVSYLLGLSTEIPRPPEAIAQMDPLYMLYVFDHTVTDMKNSRFILIGSNRNRSPIVPTPLFAPLLGPEDDGVVSKFTALYPTSLPFINTLAVHTTADEHTALPDSFSTLRDVLLHDLEFVR
jgi:triacylglycerol esterase/lipase EstA (alpha/beta hydrolase family)/V8-like Glu-specific endopeptidase